MRWKDIDSQTCSVARSTAIFGDRWTLLILRDIFMRIRRFSDLQKSLGISKHRLSDRLNRLVEAKILFKELYDPAHKRYEYKLTEKGLSLHPILVAITQWGDTWEADDDGAPIEYVHKDCGHVTTPRFTCQHCNEEIHARNTSFRPGPGILNKMQRGDDTGLDLEMYVERLQGKSR